MHRHRSSPTPTVSRSHPHIQRILKCSGTPSRAVPVAAARTTPRPRDCPLKSPFQHAVERRGLGYPDARCRETHEASLVVSWGFQKHFRSFRIFGSREYPPLGTLGFDLVRLFWVDSSGFQTAGKGIKDPRSVARSGTIDTPHSIRPRAPLRIAESTPWHSLRSASLSRVFSSICSRRERRLCALGFLKTIAKRREGSSCSTHTSAEENHLSFPHKT